MSHFNIKTLSFYAIAISSVLVLFKVVSTYGETKLNAAPNIDGSYQFFQANNLPDCLQGQQLKLNIEQSGIYLFGNLKVASSGEIPLSGDFQNNQITMAGKGNLPKCDAPLQLSIKGQRDNQNLVAQIIDDSTQKQGDFQAKFLKPKASGEESKGH